MYLGFGLAVQRWGIQAGLGLYWTIFIFTSSIITFMIVWFTSMEKIKKVLYKKPNDATNEPKSDEIPQIQEQAQVNR